MELCLGIVVIGCTIKIQHLGSKGNVQYGHIIEGQNEVKLKLFSNTKSLHVNSQVAAGSEVTELASNAALHIRTVPAAENHKGESPPNASS